MDGAIEKGLTHSVIARRSMESRNQLILFGNTIIQRVSRSLAVEFTTWTEFQN